MDVSLRERLIYQVIARAKLPLAEERAELEGSLLKFVEAAWPSLDPAPYQSSWAIEALSEHLQAVTEGQIKRLLINYPPRAGKTSVASICFPAWTWARSEKSYLSGPQVKFLCGSYNDDLALQNSTKHRRLLQSSFYQRRWGKRFSITVDQDRKALFDTSAGGSRISNSARGSLLGIGGDIIVLDDPHNTRQAESEADRKSALTWWSEISSTRLNDPKRSAIAVIMQRLHEEDISGAILSSERADDWTHLMIPMEYESRRHCVTVLGWQDPRGLDDAGEPLLERGVPVDARAARILEEREGALMWPERFGPKEIARIKAELGPYMASGRLQQSPQPRGGGIFKREWVELWDPPDRMFPVMSYVVASVDGAFTEKQSNDPSAMTVWGVFVHPELRKTRIILIDAWTKRLQLHGAPTSRLEHEIVRIGDTPQIVRRKAAFWQKRVGHEWGLVEWVAQTCRQWGVHHLLVENKGPGISAAQELQRLHGREGWSVQLFEPKGDKLARALACQPLFSNGLIYAPDRAWVEIWMTEISTFPVAKHDDLVDSTTMALSYLRGVGAVQFDDEVAAAEADRVRPRPRLAPLYPC